MDNPYHLNFTQRMLQHVQNSSSDLAAAACSEQASFYTDERRWLKEKQQFFLSTPQVVGFAGEVAQAGSYITVESMGIPLLICRSQEGQLQAFINACGHRGARVAEGCGLAKRLTCKFHGWSYNLDGQLAGRPQDNAFEPIHSQNHLTPLPVSQSSGLLVVGLTTNISQTTVDKALDPISAALQAYDFTQVSSIQTRKYTVAANWKLVTALSLEGYHFKTLHRDSLAPMMLDHTVFDDFGGHTRWGFALKGIEVLLDKAVEDWPEHFPGAVNHTLFPSTIAVASGRDAQLIRAEPGSHPGESVVYYSGVCGTPGGEADSLSAYEFGGDIFEKEDLPAAEQCQKGIDAGRQEFAIGANEPVVQAWHQKWRTQLS